MVLEDIFKWDCLASARVGNSTHHRRSRLYRATIMLLTSAFAKSAGGHRRSSDFDSDARSPRGRRDTGRAL